MELSFFKGISIEVIPYSNKEHKQGLISKDLLKEMEIYLKKVSGRLEKCQSYVKEKQDEEVDAISQGYFQIYKKVFDEVKTSDNLRMISAPVEYIELLYILIYWFKQYLNYDQKKTCEVLSKYCKRENGENMLRPQIFCASKYAIQPVKDYKIYHQRYSNRCDIDSSQELLEEIIPLIGRYSLEGRDLFYIVASNDIGVAANLVTTNNKIKKVRRQIINDDWRKFALTVFLKYDTTNFRKSLAEQLSIQPSQFESEFLNTIEDEYKMVFKDFLKMADFETNLENYYMAVREIEDIKAHPEDYQDIEDDRFDAVLSAEEYFDKRLKDRQDAYYNIVNILKSNLETSDNPYYFDAVVFSRILAFSYPSEMLDSNEIKSGYDKIKDYSYYNKPADEKERKERQVFFNSQSVKKLRKYIAKYYIVEAFKRNNLIVGNKVVFTDFSKFEDCYNDLVETAYVPLRKNTVNDGKISRLATGMKFVYTEISNTLVSVIDIIKEVQDRTLLFIDNRDFKVSEEDAKTLLNNDNLNTLILTDKKEKFTNYTEYRLQSEGYYIYLSRKRMER